MRSYSTILGALAALVALSAPAAAADVYAKDGGLKDGSAQSPAHNWSGFYVGVNAGWGWSDTHNDVAGTATFNDISDVWFKSSPVSAADTSGFIGGGQIGALMQRGVFVFGVQTDIQGSALDGSKTSAAVASITNGSESLDIGKGKLNVKQSIDWYGTATGRLGVAVGPVLVFGEGGLAYGGVNDKISTVAEGEGSTIYSASHDRTSLGWTAGGGFEYAITDHWSAGVKYRYVDLGSEAISAPIALGEGATLHAHTSDIDNSFHSVMFTGNYKISTVSVPLN
jgi:outer membrane immunogenic protein